MKTWLSTNGLFALRSEDMNMTVHFAAWTGNIESLTIKIKEGENVGKADDHGWTPLHLAFWNMHTALVENLLNVSPISISAKNRKGLTTLHIAAQNNDVELIHM